MKQAQMIGIAIATGAGLLAFVAMKMAIKPPPPKVVEAVPVDATQVLVAKNTLSNINIPALKKRQAKSTVELPSGGSLALAGLISENRRAPRSGLGQVHEGRVDHLAEADGREGPGQGRELRIA